MNSTTAKKINYLFLYFIPLLVVFGIALSFLYYSEVRSDRIVFEGREKGKVTAQADMIGTEFQSIMSDIGYLNKNHELLDLVDGKGEEARDHLAYELQSFSSMKKIYDQVRFLDETGMETVRINYNRGNPSIVPDNKLQNKGKRYYFLDVIKLDQGEVFLSPFDLNVEKGKVEKPLKPMLRFGMPTFDSQGNKKGIVLLNYFGSQLLEKFDKLADDAAGEMMLINSEGYWLKGTDPDHEWGFMFEDRKGKTFGSTYHEGWEKIQSTDSGQFYFNDDLFTFKTVYPLHEGMKSSTGSGKAFEKSQAQLGRKDYHWTIVSRVPKAILLAGSRNFLMNSLPIVMFLVLILFSISMLITRTRINREKAEQKLAEARKQIVDSAHKAGMADIATGILHNLGNVLNSLNTSAEEIRSVTDASRVESFIKANELLREHMDNISEYLTSDERGKKLPEYYLRLGSVMQEENEKIKESIGRVGEKITTMKGIIETQQEYARAEFHAESENTEKIIEDVLKIQKDLINTSGVHVTNNCKDSVRCKIQKHKLVHVLINIVKNAIEAMNHNDQRNKTKELSIESGHVDEAYDYIRITDNGCGIPEENLVKIFNHGFTTKEKGHGFGLHASSNAMNEMGGRITVDSEPGKGTTFNIDLPVAGAQE